MSNPEIAPPEPATVPPDPAADRPASQPSHAVDVRWDVRIPVRDGLALSANLWLPVPTAEAPDARVPAILEMIPYGKDSWRRNADIARGEWFAARGFAFCRLDVRGTGSSPGVALDEYTADETRDGFDAVEWLAAQPWCNGRVAMWGISYGGFTAIQVAKLRPPHLAAIVPFYATDDRYLDDVHYRGGCVTASELSQYAVSQVAMNAMPPDPAFLGEGWRGAWRDRLERTPIWLFEWLRQQTDGPYWRQGSLAPDYGRLEVPVLQVGGWNDSYVDPVFRMQERCVRAPRRSIVGNWVHSWPHDAFPGPNLDELHEVVRFLDHWLKDEPNGVMDEPGFTWFERDWALPEPFPGAWPGRWRAAPTWPHPATAERAWVLAGRGQPGRGRLVGDADRDGSGKGEGLDDDAPGTTKPTDGVDALPHRATVGTTGSLSWGAGSEPNGLARDSRPDDARSLTYTSAPLTEPVSILGFPVAVLHLSATMAVATVACRLMDVAPDGTPHQVSAGILNLTHRSSHTDPAPLEDGAVYEVRVPFRASGYRFVAGHRLRLVVATASWPVVWPSPYPGELRVHHGPEAPSRLVLPVVPPAGGPGDLEPPTFMTTTPDVRQVGGGDDEPATWQVVEDVLAGTVTVVSREAGTTELEDGRSLFASERLELTASDADPAHATFRSEVEYRWHERSFETEIRSRATISSDAQTFDLAVDLEVDVDGERLFERCERRSIPRRLV
jgi:putative CocE/NonD family hydrolase